MKTVKLLPANASRYLYKNYFPLLLAATAPVAAPAKQAAPAHPFTLNRFYNDIYEWIIHVGPRLVIGILILLFGLWLIRQVVNWSDNRLHNKKVDPSLKPFLLSLMGILLRIMLVLCVMQVIGIRMTLFATVIGALGVAAGLALSGTLQNFASGILILLLKPFVVGDNINTQGTDGTVTAIQIFYTTITTFDNRVLIVPNGQLSNQTITNLSRLGNRRLDINLKFANNIDVQQVKKVISDAIDKSEQSLKTPERRIGIGEIQPDGYIIAISVWVNAHGFQDTKLKVLEQIFESIKASGIKIPGL